MSTERLCSPLDNSEAISVVRNGMHTRVEILKSTQMWQIQNFSMCDQDVGEKLISPKFTVGTNGEVQWNLTLYPRGKTQEFKDYIALFLNLVPRDRTCIRIKLQFSVLNSMLKKIGTMAGVSSFSKDREVSNWLLSFCGWDTFLKRDFVFNEKNELLPNDVLSVYCDVLMETEPMDIGDLKKSICMHVPEFQLADNLASFYNNEKFSDITLVVEDKSFYAHKAILAANSIVFFQMLENEWQNERGDRVIEIGDLTINVAAKLLYFMYTGKLDANIDVKEIEDLMVASDKYVMGRLKALCEEHLVSSITTESVADLMVLSDAHNASQLKEYCLDFIKKHASKITETASWNDIALRRPKLLLEAFKSLTVENDRRKKKLHHT